ncbi:MAG: metallophosphoesterase [Pricia sp.]
MNRRKFLIKLLFGGAALAFLDAYWFERYIIDWNEYDISEGAKDKIKAVHLSDLHFGSLRSVHESLAERINEERPDVIFFTGDSVDRTKYLPNLNAFLSLIDRDIPKFAVLGNVDYEGHVDFDLLRKTYEMYGGNLLVNKNHKLQVRNRTINLVGTDDYLCGYPDFSKATEGLDWSHDTIVLSHCPAYRDEIDVINAQLGRKVKLVLSGHTHGGQITFFGKAIFTPYGSGDYVSGWYRNEYSSLYVSKGIGTRVIPFRFGSRAEAIILHI